MPDSVSVKKLSSVYFSRLNVKKCIFVCILRYVGAFSGVKFLIQEFCSGHYNIVAAVTWVETEKFGRSAALIFILWYFMTKFTNIKKYNREIC